MKPLPKIAPKGYFPEPPPRWRRDEELAAALAGLELHGQFLAEAPAGGWVINCRRSANRYYFETFGDVLTHARHLGIEYRISQFPFGNEEAVWELFEHLDKRKTIRFNFDLREPRTAWRGEVWEEQWSEPCRPLKGERGYFTLGAFPNVGDAEETDRDAKRPIPEERLGVADLAPVLQDTLYSQFSAVSCCRTWRACAA